MRSIDMTKALALAAAAVLALVFTGCVKRQALDPAWVVPADCEFLPAPPDVPDTVTVAVFDDVGPELAPCLTTPPRASRTDTCTRP